MAIYKYYTLQELGTPEEGHSYIDQVNIYGGLSYVFW